MLVDLEPKPMACPMKESNSPAFAHLRRKTTLCKEFLNCFMNRHPIDSRLDLLQSKRLPGFHRFPKSSLRLARTPAQHGASHVTEVPGLRVARKNVKNDQRVRVERTKAALVRIAPLIAAGNNCSSRDSTGAQDCRIDLGAQHFEVSVLPRQRNRFPAPGLDLFKMSTARSRPSSVIRRAWLIISISLFDFASRSGQKKPFVA